MRKPMIAWVMLGACLWVLPAAHADNGDVDFATPLCGNSGAISGADLTYDTTTDQLWVLGFASGQICRYALSAFPPDILFSTTINHPFGPAVFPTFTPVCTGIAYRTSSQTLFVMNATTLELLEIDDNGIAQGPPVTLSPPLGNAAVSGLAYDTVTGNLWYRDIVNDIAVECNPANGSTVSFIPLPGEPTMFGSGLGFVEDAGARYLEFTRGNVLEFQPSEMVRIDATTGQATCVEVDLSQVPDPVIGVVRPLSGTVIYATTAEDAYKIDATLPPVQPPTELVCRANVDGTASIQWRNCGPGAGGLYTSVRVLRAGVVVQILPGGSTTYIDPDPEPSGSQITYQIQGIVGSDVAESTCVVDTGPGGLVSYTQFDGIRPYDLALNEASGLLYVTDNQSDLIYVYDTDLNLTTVLSTGLQNLQGIAYNSSLDLLLVSRTGSTLLRTVDPLTGLLGMSSTPVDPAADISAITYDANNDDYLYVDANANPVVICRIDANPASPGNPLGCFSPIQGSGLLLGRGVCYLGSSDTFLAPVQSSTSGGLLTSVHELDPNGVPSGFSFPLDAIGASLELNDSIRGVEDLANVIFMAGSASNTIFRVLIASGGSAFIRGEVNGDLVVDLADALSVANYLFQGGTAPGCLDSADINDDGGIDISDPLYLIIHLFSGGPPPPSPYPALGPDPTFLDPLGC